MSKYNYVSLFSSAGVGCFDLKKNGFDCLATNELLPQRLNIQKINQKCSDPKSYIQGSIEDPEVYDKLIDLVLKKKKQKGKLDILFATPPCQGMSVANHKKNSEDLNRNSLVVKSVEIVKELKPNIFVFENVQSFLKTFCVYKDSELPIGDMINLALGEDYIIESAVLNFKFHGVNSSRTRTLVIGTKRNSNLPSPCQLFPEKSEPKNLYDLIGHLPRLKTMGEISADPLHSFREYSENMRVWIQNTPEGSSAFENVLAEHRPHQIINFKLVENKNLNGDKYKRQSWFKNAPCIHTRNDILSSQNTIHPEDDRVFSIRELMILMNIPNDFKWFEEDLQLLQKKSFEDQRRYLSKFDLTIRHCIGEAVPTKVFSAISNNYLSLINNQNNNNWMNSMDFKNQVRGIEKIFYYQDDIEVKMYLNFFKIKNSKFQIIGISQNQKINLFDFVIVQSNKFLAAENEIQPLIRRFNKQLSLI